MGIKLYDLAGAEPERRFSPYCWRIKFALAHKGLAVETVPWRFTDKDAIAFSGQERVPVLIDGGRVLFDSWTIATYLEETYPERPSLFGSAAAVPVTRFINAFSDTVVSGGLVRLIVTDVHAHLHEKDRAYFRESREKRFGMKLEAITADRDTRVRAFRESLEPLRVVLKSQPWLGGNAPRYADYIIMGHLMWARCISPFRLLSPADPVAEWRARMMGLFGGMAADAPGYAV